MHNNISLHVYNVYAICDGIHSRVLYIYILLIMRLVLRKNTCRCELIDSMSEFAFDYLF